MRGVNPAALEDFGVSPEQFGAAGLWIPLHGLLRLAGAPGSGEEVPAPPCA